MGAYRFFLAFCVLLSHTGFSVLGYNPGVVAVISFLLLSAYVMTRLIEHYYNSHDRLLDFYLDRSTRLFPQYLVTLGVLFALFKSGMLRPELSFLSDCDGSKWALNALVLPAGYYAFNELGTCLPIPQAWSLGLEASFYLVVPFLVARTRWLAPLAALSFSIFLAAYFGAIDSDQFGYRLLPGTLFIFIAGIAFARGGSWRFYPWAVWLAAAVLFAYLSVNARLYALPYSKEVLLGLLVGIPVLAFLKSRPITAADAFLGTLSYGVFLNHFAVIWVMQRLGYDFAKVGHYALLTAASLLLAIVTYWLVERTAIGWRRSLRLAPSSPALSATKALV